MIIRQSYITSYIEACALKSYLDYDLHIHPYRSEALVIGSLFHDTYAAVFNEKIKTGMMLSLIQVIEAFSQQYEALDWSSIDAPRDVDRTRIRLDALACITGYYATARLIHGVQASELDGQAVIGQHTVTTHLDLQTSGGIIEFKTARVGRGRNNTEYILDYSDRNVQWRVQPLVHMVIFGAQPYRYHVVGKGDTVVVKEYIVQHTQDYVDLWRERVLIPVLDNIAAKHFPAKLSALCSVCAYKNDKQYCGIGV